MRNQIGIPPLKSTLWTLDYLDNNNSEARGENGREGGGIGLDCARRRRRRNRYRFCEREILQNEREPKMKMLGIEKKQDLRQQS